VQVIFRLGCSRSLGLFRHTHPHFEDGRRQALLTLFRNAIHESMDTAFDTFHLGVDQILFVFCGSNRFKGLLEAVCQKVLLLLHDFHSISHGRADWITDGTMHLSRNKHSAKIT